MRVSRLATAEDFLAQTERLRSADPFRTNVLGSVATSVTSGGRKYEKCFWWIVSDDEGEVIGAAMRTAPHAMVFSPMPIESAQRLAAAVIEADQELPEVGGPTQVVQAFLESYRESGGKGARLVEESEHHLLYVLNKLAIPAVEGSMRRASPDDFEKILSWFMDFGNEARILMHHPTESVADGFTRKSWRLWIVDNEVVSMAGHAQFVEVPDGKIARIGPVFTPKAHRRRGYAGALTAHLSKELTDLGARVMLYTDANNPTSNGVYQRIGFELFDENRRYKFLESEC